MAKFDIKIKNLFIGIYCKENKETYQKQREGRYLHHKTDKILVPRINKELLKISKNMANK